MGKTMIKCHVWEIVLLLFNILSLTIDASIVGEHISMNDDRKRSMEIDDSVYSWTGPNALARSALVERQERLQYNCEEILGDREFENENLNPKSFRNILVDEQHELLYCYVPKVRLLNFIYKEKICTHNRQIFRLDIFYLCHEF